VNRKPRDRSYEAFGAYVRNQREMARLSLRQAAALARISNPYLSQIEHGLALPSVTVIRALADALHVSADTLLLLAAGMAADQATQRSAVTEHAILHDPRLDEAQKHALLAVLNSFVGPSSAGSDTAHEEVGAAPIPLRAPRRRRKPKAPPNHPGDSDDREVPDHA
jgi:transcriptional regulator with XRE-family HTH domain